MRTLAQKENQSQERVSSSPARSKSATSRPIAHTHPILRLQRTINIVKPTWQDFHIVAGRVDATGNDPTDVYSKNRRRPVYGPGTGPNFRPPNRDRATSNDQNEQPITTPQGHPVFKVRSNMSESITCAQCNS
jgi:hypothetical protein